MCIRDRGTVCAAIINVVLNAVFIPLFGYVAAAYTTVVCYVLYFFFHLFIARRILGRFLFDMKSLFLCMAGVVAFSAICLLLINNFWIRWGILAVFLAAAMIVAIWKRKDIKAGVVQLLGRK